MRRRLRRPRVPSDLPLPHSVRVRPRLPPARPLSVRRQRRRSRLRLRAPPASGRAWDSRLGPPSPLEGPPRPRRRPPRDPCLAVNPLQGRTSPSVTPQRIFDMFSFLFCGVKIKNSNVSDRGTLTSGSIFGGGATSTAAKTPSIFGSSTATTAASPFGSSSAFGQQGCFHHSIK